MKKKLAAIPLVTALAITPLTSVFGESNEVNARSSSQISSYSESYVTENNEKYTEYDYELGKFYLLNTETNEKNSPKKTSNGKADGVFALVIK